MKKVLIFLSAMWVACGLSGCGPSPTVPSEEEKVLNVYTWIDYIPPEIIQQFERETGIRVAVDYYDSNEVLEAKLLTGHSGYDIVFPTAFPYLQRQIKADVFAPLDHTQLPNWQHLDPELLQRLMAADPNHRFAIPYLWGTNGIGYNRGCLKKLGLEDKADSAALLFDPAITAKIAPHGLTFLDSPAEVYPAALVYLGLDPNDQTLENLRKVSDHLSRVRPHVRHFSSLRFVADLANGESCVVQGWSGDIRLAQLQAQAAGNKVEIGFTIPKEGAEIWCDTVAIPKRPPHPGNAHKFLNYLMRPEVIARITNKLGYANGNRTATALVDAEIRHNPMIYPPAEVRARLYTLQLMPLATERQRTRLWTRVKTNQ